MGGQNDTPDMGNAETMERLKRLDLSGYLLWTDAASALLATFFDGDMGRQPPLESVRLMLLDLLATAQPSDQAKQLHCRDCKAFCPNATPHDPDHPHFCSLHGSDWVEPDGFCAWAHKTELWPGQYSTK